MKASLRENGERIISSKQDGLGCKAKSRKVQFERQMLQLNKYDEKEMQKPHYSREFQRQIDVEVDEHFCE